MDEPATAMVPETDTTPQAHEAQQQQQQQQALPAAGVTAEAARGEEVAAAAEGAVAVWPPAAEQLAAVERRLRARPVVQYEPVGGSHLPNHPHKVLWRLV